MKIYGSLSAFKDLLSSFATIIGSADGTTSNSVTVQSGAASAGNSGDVTIKSGTATGTRGIVTLASGSGGLKITQNGGTNTTTITAPTSTATITLPSTTGTLETTAGAASQVSTGVSTHAGLTTTHGVAGTLVGTSDNQTLTNKTIAAGNNTISGLTHGTHVDNPSSGVHGVVGTVVGTTDAQTLTNKTLTDPLISVDGVTPSNPAAGNVKVYAKSDDKLYILSSSGIESAVGSGGATVAITQASHGFSVGDALYYTGSAYAKAQAHTAATAEAIGIVSRVLTVDRFELTEVGQVTGLSGLTAGSVYFLSDTTAGLLTTTEPTTLGMISKPMLIADSTTSGYAVNMRGVVVGGTNARTQVTLSNNATTTVQNVSAYNAGELAGWVYVNATTPTRFFVKAQFAKLGSGTDYSISYQVSGDTLVGFTMSVTAAGLIQITLPSVTGFVSAFINFGLNVPAVGATFPLTISTSQLSGTIPTSSLSGTISSSVIEGRTDGVAPSTGMVGETSFTSDSSVPVTSAWTTSSAIPVKKGTYLVSVYSAPAGGASRVSGSVGFSTDSVATTFSDQSGGVNFMQFAVASDGRGQGQFSSVVTVPSDTNYYIKVLSFGANATSSTNSIRFTRIA